MTASETATQFREGFVDADGFHIRYLEAGEGEPLVDLHGGAGVQLTAAHEILARDRRVIAFEAPGFGRSAVNDRTRSMTDLANTILQAVSALGIDRFSLMGTSFGGALALDMAFQDKERLDALVLVSPAAIRAENPPPIFRMSAEERRALLSAHPERRPPAEPEDPAIAAKQRDLVQRIFRFLPVEELQERMAQLDLPVLLLFGTLDPLTPPELGRVYRQALPRSSLIFVYDAGHTIAFDRPEAFANVVGDFLNRHEGFLVKDSSSLLFP